MAMPLREVTALNQDLVSRLEHKHYIEDREIFEYRKKLQNIAKDTAEGAVTWAFYHACRQEKQKSLEYFRKSLHFNDPSFIYNYFVYLRGLGATHELVFAVSKMQNRYNNVVSILKEYYQAACWMGDVSLMQQYIDSMIKMSSPEDKELHKRLKKDLLIFIERSELSLDEFKRLMNLTANFVDINSISYLITGIICLSDKNINSFFVVSTLQNINEIRKNNFLYSVELAKEQRFDNKNFMAGIISSEQKMSEALNMDITYEDGYYTAECNELHLVTESISLDELHCLIWDLTPDLIELNELSLDPYNVLFKFNYSKSAKARIRGQ